MAFILLHCPAAQATILYIGKDLHSHGTHRLRCTVYHATNPLRRFAAEGRFSAACADASRDTLDQDIFPVDHKYFINRFLVRFRRTAHMTEKHATLPFYPPLYP